MIWLARYCDRMTKRDRAKNNEAKAAVIQNQAQQIQTAHTLQTQVQQGQKINVISQPTMAGFLNN